MKILNLMLCFRLSMIVGTFAFAIACDRVCVASENQVENVVTNISLF